MKKIIFSNNSILLFLSLAGMALSAYLWNFQVNPNLIVPCTGDGCKNLLKSEYSFVFKVPMAVFGFFYYSFLATIFLQRYFINHKFLNILTFFTILFGIIFSLYLRYLELFKIHSICSLCLISFMIILAVSITYFLRPKNWKNP